MDWRTWGEPWETDVSMVTGPGPHRSNGQRRGQQGGGVPTHRGKGTTTKTVSSRLAGRILLLACRLAGEQQLLQGPALAGRPLGRRLRAGGAVGGAAAPAGVRGGGLAGALAFPVAFPLGAGGTLPAFPLALGAGGSAASCDRPSASVSWSLGASASASAGAGASARNAPDMSRARWPRMLR